MATGRHRKHGIRLLARSGEAGKIVGEPRGRRIDDDVVLEAVILTWEASDRICSKRRRAHYPTSWTLWSDTATWYLDSEVRSRLLTASAATLDLLLKPVKARVASRRKRRCHPDRGQHIPARNFAD